MLAEAAVRPVREQTLTLRCPRSTPSVLALGVFEILGAELDGGVGGLRAWSPDA